mmetsp:Transcript_12780/g.51024  ORF Transcript_12780/g.51024 Transcript_12780/m.51024 type:complete len:418 (-) Transcript_12780:62-1315(-)|eukprot:CAMPEP_0114620564 /NCGR_PEP_ID=MMETSP0168-20121206/8790_1 /TAXON_ID=95228 ORGANISM="Vannella sp., Strain DIVA3 517/6/12" /NCGR_SAMPLE_ID=MMETSP0168 /ASSEMBLY_ACC=CAM_ASM_000044 /LENGTH=417 /DNA_ID=CAMNT_0001831759 /DNA_START=128 /DNA_END=1381 /DNA_ORIENTATION=+
MADDEVEKKSSRKHRHGDKDKEKKHRSSRHRDKDKDVDKGEHKKRKHRSSKHKKDRERDPEKKHRSKSSKSKSSSKHGDKEKREKRKRKEKTVAEAQKEIEEEMADSGEEGDEVITVFEDKYTVGDELGRGAFSVVKLVTSKRSGRQYAVKVIDKKDVGQDMARLRTEIEILTRVKHPNIINLKEIMEDDHTLFIITELVTGGELFDKIVELGAYTEADAALLVGRMVRAIDYLHGMGIVHRDLKPENLLLKNPDDISEVKLADFGLSKIVTPGANAAMMQTACGTPGYVAPEVLTADGYDKEVDLWSIGVITYILLCGFPPFYNEHLPMLFEQIMKADYDYPADYWEDISDTAKNFIDRLLVVDPARRMTTKQALEHPWLLGQAPDKKIKLNNKMASYVQQYREASRANLKQDAAS